MGRVSDTPIGTSMYNLPFDFDFVKQNPHIPLMDLYRASVPSKPYCTDDLSFLEIRPKIDALLRRYVQHNPPYSISTLVIDYDDSESHYKWDDLHTPPPNFCAMNKTNGHCHLYYVIRNKVYKNKSDNMQSYRLLSAIENALVLKLGADKGYANFISKNPFNNSWVLYNFRDFPFDLYDFFDYLELPKKILVEPYLFNWGLGRNCTLFEEMRRYAYSAIREYNYDTTIDTFIDIIYQKASTYNKIYFDIPLQSNEVLHTCRSIGKWVYRNFSETKFSQIQSERAKRLAEKRKSKMRNDYIEVFDYHMKNPKLSVRQLAIALGVSPATVSRAINYSKQLASQNTSFDNQLDLL